MVHVVKYGLTSSMVHVVKYGLTSSMLVLHIVMLLMVNYVWASFDKICLIG